MHVTLPIILILLSFCHGLTIPKDLSAFYCFASRLLYLVINDGKCDPEVNEENCKNEASLLTSIYSVSDLEFKGRIFHALKIAKNCFNPKFQFLDGRRAPRLNNLKTEEQTKHHSSFQVSPIAEQYRN